jgi:hypothetical protein
LIRVGPIFTAMADREHQRHSRSSQRRHLTNALEQWATSDRHRRNLLAVLLSCGVMVWLSVAAWGLPDRVAFLRSVAAAFAAAHGVRHVLVICTLARLRREGMAEAARALDAYRDPLRLNSLDLAAAWLGFMVLVPIIDRLAGPFPIGS